MPVTPGAQVHRELVSRGEIAWRIRVTRNIWYPLGYQILHGGRILHAKVMILMLVS
jgi:hypothetical protein